MVDTAAWLVDVVIPAVPVRQWVLSLPYRVRTLCAYDAAACRLVRNVLVRAVSQRSRECQKNGVTSTTAARGSHGSTGKLEEAEPLLREMETVYGKVRGPSSRAVALAQLELGHLRALQRRFADAEVLFAGSLPVLVNLLPVGKADVQRGERYCAEFYAAWQAAEPDPARAAKAAEWQAKVAAAK